MVVCNFLNLNTLCPDLIRASTSWKHIRRPGRRGWPGRARPKLSGLIDFLPRSSGPFSAELTCGAGDPYLGQWARCISTISTSRCRRELIADHPCEPREAARLLHIPATGGFADRRIADLPALLRPGDLLVCNDTKVIPARLVARRGGATIDITLSRDQGSGSWRAFARGARRLHVGDRLAFAEDFAATVAEKHPEGDVTLHFDLDSDALRAALARHGTMPLPPYIKRARGGDARDRARLSDDVRPRRGRGRCADGGSAFHPGADRGADKERRRLGDPNPACRPRDLSTGQIARPARP